MRVESGRMPTSMQRLTRAGLAAAITLVTPVLLGAQGSNRDQPIAPFSSFYIATGTLLMDVTRLNPHFERVDLPAAQRPGFYTLSNDGYSVGVGGYGPVLGRFVAGGEFHSADLGSESSPTGKTNQLQTKYWMATAGYAAFTAWRFSAIPFVGIGTGTATLTLKNRSGGPQVSNAIDPTFDEVIASPGAKSTMTGSYVIVQPGLALDFIVLQNDASSMGLTLGLRMAKSITPNRTTWRYEGREVFGGPDLGPSGGSFRIVVGIGGFRLASTAKGR